MRGKPGLAVMVLVIEVAVLLAGCGREGERGGPAGKPPSETSPQQPPEGTRKPAAEEPGQRPAVQRFSGTIGKIPSRNTVKYSWRPGCPVPLSRLRLLRMTYWGFDRRTHTGEMVVNARVADDVVKVFRRLYDQRYPVRRMQLVDVYKGSDFASIDADNTSAFNCRAATGSSSWSQHAYGLAIDVNPCENPYVTGSGQTAHKHCRKHVDRARRNPGVIRAGDKTVRAFRSIGWGWGGAWSGTKDYQHFSSNGR